MKELLKCELCPRSCGVDRNIQRGYCGLKNEVKVAKAFLHMWEEPCISGEKGSGTIFFSNCNLKCVFCQNSDISHGEFGKEISVSRLGEIMLELEEKGANNINLVTPSPYIIHIREAIETSRRKGLKIPILYNSSGYESVEALKLLKGYIDIYLPDIKYFDRKYGSKYSNVPEYFKYTEKAVLEMFSQVGAPKFENGIITKGLMIRHMMLPGLLFDSKKIVDWVINNLPREVYFNIMCQYTPMGNAVDFPEINKRVNERHYEALINYALESGLENGFFQEFSSATSEYTPVFNLEGV